MLSGGLFQAPQTAIPGLACCLEHSILTRENPSSEEGDLGYLGRERHRRAVFEKGVGSNGSTVTGQQWNLPRWTCIQPVTTEPLVPKEQLFQEFEPK